MVREPGPDRGNPLSDERGHHLADSRPHDVLDLRPGDSEMDDRSQLTGGFPDLWRLDHEASPCLVWNEMFHGVIANGSNRATSCFRRGAIEWSRRKIPQPREFAGLGWEDGSWLLLRGKRWQGIGGPPRSDSPVLNIVLVSVQTDLAGKTGQSGHRSGRDGGGDTHLFTAAGKEQTGRLVEWPIPACDAHLHPGPREHEAPGEAQRRLSRLVDKGERIERGRGLLGRQERQVSGRDPAGSPR